MKICFLSPYFELSIMANTIIKNRNLTNTIDVVEATLEESIDLLPQLEAKGYHVIITRGATYSQAKRLTTIPVVSCAFNAFDILNALQQAKKLTHTGKVGLILNIPLQTNVETLSEILGVELVHDIFDDNRHQVIEIMNSMLRSGVDVIVGGQLTVSCCQEKGCKSVLIVTSENTVNAAIDQAIQISHSRKLERVRAEQFSKIINTVNFGIIMLDDKDNISMCNSKAKQLLNIADLNLSETDVAGKIKYALTTYFHIGELGSMRVNEETLIKSVGKHKLLLTLIPIVIDDESQGQLIVLQRAEDIQALEESIRAELYTKGLVTRYSIKDFLGSCTHSKNIRHKIESMSGSDSTVLITGETGTGKEILAQSIHTASNRKNGPFVAINCSVFPENLLESELFGYEEGSFTGAKKGGSIGLFELAHNGTIFLDEIGDLPQNVQAQLLRVLEEKQIRKIGSNIIKYIDVRIIAATNKNLIQATHSGDFRQDLYYRLNVMSLHTIPLREHKEDIELLLFHFLEGFGCADLYSPSLAAMLCEYDWPGNVRELQNFSERLCIMRNEMTPQQIFSDYIRESNLYEQNSSSGTTIIVKKDTLYNMELSLINACYYMVDGNITRLAADLGVSRTTIWSKLKQSEAQQNLLPKP